MTALKQINKLVHQLPLSVLQDIYKRTTDWLAGGGDADDPYMYQQLRYAENVIRSGENEDQNPRRENAHRKTS